MESSRKESPTSRSPQTGAIVASVLAIALVWSYWPNFADMVAKWSNDPQYSHAYLIPLFSLALVWRSRSEIAMAQPRISWWGAGLLVVAAAMRLVGTMYYFEWLESVSLIPMIAGLVWFLCGWRVFRHTAVAIGFLLFMIPLPFSIETGLSLPLQRMATTGATFMLQTIGRSAFAEGNVIVINDSRVGIVEACNGLGMFLLFFAMAAAVALLVNRPIWQKIILFLSAAPIAVGVNIARIVFTTLIHELIQSPSLDRFVHDFAGWLMMPTAIVLLWLELKFLSRLFVEQAALGRTQPVKLQDWTMPKLQRKSSAASTSR